MHILTSAQAPKLLQEQDSDATTLRVLLVGVGITVVGFVGVAFQTGSLAWIGLLWALALYVLGVFVGFLFSVSRVVENTTAAASGDESSVRYLPNTGLEQIADWLTKIIVGLTLVELQKIPPAILSLSTIIATSIGNTDGVKGLAYAMVIFFPIVGFLGMYLSTRLYINQGIRKAEERARNLGTVAREALDNPQTTLENPNAGVTGAVTSIATDIANVPLEKLNTADEIAAWSRAQAVLGQWGNAIRGFKKAIKLNPSDPKLRLDYAVALFNDGVQSEPVIRQLEAGLKLVDQDKDPDLASRLLTNLALAYLYLPPPDGFTKALETLERVLNSTLPKRPDFYFYVACAYGQKYAYLKKRGADPKELKEARDKAIEFVRKTLDLEPSFVAKFQKVSDPKYPNKVKEDSDLEALADDPEFRALVWKDAKTS